MAENFRLRKQLEETGLQTGLPPAIKRLAKYFDTCVTISLDQDDPSCERIVRTVYSCSCGITQWLINHLPYASPSAIIHEKFI